MRPIVFAVLAISLLFATVCRAEHPVLRDQAMDAVERIQMRAPPTNLYEEFRNIMETFANAEDLSTRERLDEAENMYRLVLLKAALYEEKIREGDKGTLGSERSAPAVQEGSVAPGGVRTEAQTQPKTEGGRGPKASPASGTGDAATSSNDAAEAVPPRSVMITGRKRIYTVRRGDTLRKLGARFGVNWRVIARDNSLNPKKVLQPGCKLRIDTTRIIPKSLADGIVINIPERTLYLFKGRKLEKTLPVGLGRKKGGSESPWETPTGKFRIVSKVKDPTWYVPTSIQSEMRQHGKTVQTMVPPGDDNPLGKYALKTSISGILIHGTIFPDSIYRFSSHGCIRVLPRNMEEIFKEIKVDTDGEIIYQPVKLAVSDDGRVFLEVHRDIYDRFKSLDDVAKGLIIRNKAEGMVDWDKVRSLVREKSGIPGDVTAQPAREPLRTSMKEHESDKALP